MQWTSLTSNPVNLADLPLAAGQNFTLLMDKRYAATHRPRRSQLICSGQDTCANGAVCADHAPGASKSQQQTNNGHSFVCPGLASKGYLVGLLTFGMDMAIVVGPLLSSLMGIGDGHQEPGKPPEAGTC